MKALRLFITTIIFSYSCVIVYAQGVIIDNRCTDITKIPNEWIQKAKDSLNMVYGHTSHGSQLTSGGMTALFNYYGDKYAYGTDAYDGSVLFLNDVYDGMDITKENWVQPTRDYLDDSTHCNVVMWSWCSFGVDADHVNAYIDSMEALIADYPDVNFIFFTGHNDDNSTEEVVANRKRILEHCIDSNRILFDFTAIEAYDPDGNYFGDWDTTTNELLGISERHNLTEITYFNMEGASTPEGNWGNLWQTDYPESVLTALAQDDVCTSCAHSENSRLHCVLKGAAVWWMSAVLVGWDDGGASNSGHTGGSSTGGSGVDEEEDNDHASVSSNQTANFEVYPNPTDDGRITVVYTNRQKASIRVVNILGNQVYHKEAIGVKTTLNLIGNPAGVYFIMLLSDGKTEIKRVIIN